MELPKGLKFCFEFHLKLYPHHLFRKQNCLRVIQHHFSHKLYIHFLHLCRFLEQLYILTVVRDSEEVVVQQDLAETLGKDKSFILRIVDSLENDGLIRRIVDSNDRRRNILEVTYLGNQLVNRFYEIEWKVTEVFFKGISEEEIDAYYSVIAKIRANFDNCELIK